MNGNVVDSQVADITLKGATIGEGAAGDVVEAHLDLQIARIGRVTGVAGYGSGSDGGRESAREKLPRTSGRTEADWREPW